MWLGSIVEAPIRALPDNIIPTDVLCLSFTAVHFQIKKSGEGQRTPVSREIDTNAHEAARSQTWRSRDTWVVRWYFTLKSFGSLRKLFWQASLVHNWSSFKESSLYLWFPPRFVLWLFNTRIYLHKSLHCSPVIQQYHAFQIGGVRFVLPKSFQVSRCGQTRGGLLTRINTRKAF